MILSMNIYPKGIILNKHNIDNQAVTHYFNFISKGYRYSKAIYEDMIQIVVYDSSLQAFGEFFIWNEYMLFLIYLT